MDRNVVGDVMGKALAVALRKESVDRNLLTYFIIYLLTASLSARRAWIEIDTYPGMIASSGSLSARRAWIEINYIKSRIYDRRVALRKESVDRNSCFGY